MTFYNIHTHHLPDGDPTVTSIVNLIIRDAPIVLPLPETSSGNLFFSSGIHPWYISNPEKQLQQLRHIAHLGIIAIGEAGLDKLASPPFPLQQDIFTAQAMLAEEVQKPLIIHCVKAWSELIAIKKKLAPAMPWIIHGFRGNRELSGQLINQGFFLSFSHRFNPDTLRPEILNRIFLETDDTTTGIKDVYQATATHLHLETELFAMRIREYVREVFSI